MPPFKFLLISVAAALAGGLFLHPGASGGEVAQAGRASPSALAQVEVDEHAEATGAAHAAQAGSAGPLTWKTDLAIWTLVVFVVLLLVLKRFAWGPISAGLDRREQRIAEHIAAAERRHDEARQLLADYERRLAAAHDQVRGILEEARRDAEHTTQEILAKARADATAEMARGKREIETATAHALRELATTSANLAVDLAGKIVRTNLTPADHNRLVEEALSSFPQGDHRRN